MSACDQSVMRRIENALSEIECEFQYLFCDVNIDPANKLRSDLVYLQRLQFAAQLVAAAGRIVGESAMTIMAPSLCADIQLCA